jgi:tRNA-dihydrouridine synthase
LQKQNETTIVCRGRKYQPWNYRGVAGNGDVYNWEDAVAEQDSMVQSGLMIGRGALIKPWIFTEIKERR